MRTGESLAGTEPDLQGVEVAILGDLSADVSVQGEPTGFARQDAAPILTHTSEGVEAGRAGAAARAVAALGGVPRLVGVVGEDRRGAQVLASLAERGIDTEGILRVPGFETPVRLRVFVGGGAREDRLLVRVDREPRGKPPAGTSGEILGRVRDRAGAAAFLFVDGGYGIASPGAAELVPGVRIALSHDRVMSFRAMTALVLDEECALRATGRTVAKDGSARAAAHAVLSASDAGHLLLVRGRLPGVWFSPDGDERRLDPAAGPARGEAERAAGALALALGAGLDFGAAAAISVTVPGT